MIRPQPNILELPILERAELAMEAAMEMSLRNTREGLPLYIWRDGKVVAASAEELRPHS